MVTLNRTVMSRADSPVAECVVERVLDSRVVCVSGIYRKQYLVKWDKWDHEHNTWEPEEHLNGTSKLDEFFQRKQKLIDAAFLPRNALK